MKNSSNFVGLTINNAFISSLVSTLFIPFFKPFMNVKILGIIKMLRLMALKRNTYKFHS